VLDFASALYLGLRHPSESLRSWAQLTTGVPAALAERREAGRIAAALASLTGVECALLARSTLHAFWDVFGAFEREPGSILVDSGAYPIARWGATRAAARGVPIRVFPHHDADALSRILRRVKGPSGRSWVITDGFCTGCGRLAPLADYLAVARASDARLIIDDTQALGVLGEGISSVAPYGRGGGGSLRAAVVRGPEVLLVASLAKGFGAPLAFVGAPREVITHLREASETRVHTSPPSTADLRAAERALAVNRTSGDAARFRLAGLVARLRSGFGRLGLGLCPSLFPFQRIVSLPGQEASALHSRLAALGVRTVPHRPACAQRPGLAFLVTAHHTQVEIDGALRAVAVALRRVRLRAARAHVG
jgi:8-amino-7-oxononanoate synthase